MPLEAASPVSSRRSVVTRRLVLGVALALGIVAALPRSGELVSGAPMAIVTPAMAQTAPRAGDTTAPRVPDASKQDTPATAKGSKATPSADGSTDGEAADAPAASDSGAAAEVTIDSSGVRIQKHGGKRVRVQGLGQDREFDSFEEFVHQAPWLAGLVFSTVLLVFLVPLLIVALLVWYKIRKTRMQNETMIKLAEKGVVPPAEAMEALSPRVPVDVPPSAAPLYEQARQIQRRAAWSDLRKGVVLVAIGLAFIFYSIFDDGSPNWVGLICLFLGLGYGVLWYFEDRTAAPRPRDAGRPPAGTV